jgi:hypothetical protein
MALRGLAASVASGSRRHRCRRQKLSRSQFFRKGRKTERSSEPVDRAELGKSPAEMSQKNAKGLQPKLEAFVSAP